MAVETLIHHGSRNGEQATELEECRSRLFQLIDKEIQAGGGFGETTAKMAGDAQKKTELLARWKHAKSVWNGGQIEEGGFSRVVEAVDHFFAWESQNSRLQVLRNCNAPAVTRVKQELLAMLRKVNVFVLERGALEAYYPNHITGKDKPSEAQDFCNKIITRDDVLALCGEQHDADGKSLGKEFEVICTGLFQDI